MDTYLKIKRETGSPLFGVLVCFLIFVSCGEGHTIKRKSAPADVAYFCPMDTLVNTDAPGKCPDCKMKLRKNPDYAGGDPDSFVVTTMGDTVMVK
jgi:hypothetical protein